ncbi:hypothetical protein HPP92_010493 [Vanilla planifolia]|uniref:Uncharacterized protein n=1 Tax=Vanilla planifolia TaxID=51239 RepID=A0A835V049_VANPL|nr:hypothetical protein HPP92_010493 [Vanilla planifolia]
MGCGGSKEEVATGNTVSAKSLQRKKSDLPKGSAVAPHADTEKKPVSVEPDANTDGSQKETAEEAEKASKETVEEIGQGKMVSKESPDSSKKEEEATVGVTIDNGAAAAMVAVEKGDVSAKEGTETSTNPASDVDKQSAKDSKEEEEVTLNEENKGSDLDNAEKKN